MRAAVTKRNKAEAIRTMLRNREGPHVKRGLWDMDHSEAGGQKAAARRGAVRGLQPGLPRPAPVPPQAAGGAAEPRQEPAQGRATVSQPCARTYRPEQPGTP